MNIESFQALLNKEYQDGNLTGDTLAAAKDVACTVKDFMAKQSIGLTNEENGRFAIDASFDVSSIEATGVDAIKELIAASNVPAEFRAQAAASVASLLFASAKAGGTFVDMAAHQTSRGENNNNVGVIAMENLLPTSVQSSFVETSMEEFGATSDKVISDLQVAITVSLLKWHNTLTPRILSTIPTSQPVVTYVREEVKVYDLQDNDVDKDKTVIDMYADPSIVSNELTKIIPLTANNVDGEVVVNGMLAFGKEAPLLALGLDAALYGHAAFNRTDIVADGVLLETVSITIDSDVAGGGDQFDITIPISAGRLTRVANQVSTMRQANIQHTVVIDTDTLTAGGGNSTQVDDIVKATGDKLVIKLDISPRIDLRNGSAFAIGSVSISAVSSVNGAAAAATDTELDTTTVALVGYALDARYSEENNRKSNIATTCERIPLSYEIPQGRNYVMDIPHTGPAVDRSRNTANLHNIIRIGQDDVTLTTVRGVLNDVGVQTAAYAASPIAANKPGRLYAAGGRVRPTFVSATLDMTGVNTFGDDRRQDAIEGRALTFITAVCASLMTDSYHDQQLDGKPVKFRLITSGNILANIVGARPGTYQQENTSGVQLTLKLSSGTILECVTTTFDSMNTDIILIPFLSEDPSSELNFGHNRDYGTIVGSYSHSSNNASVQRLLANVRELPVPTNAVGAIINVTNIADATYFTAN